MGLAAPPGAGDKTDQLISQALKQSGITGQIETLGRTILESIPMDAFPDRKSRTQAESFLKKSIGDKFLGPLVHQAIREEVSEQNLVAVLGFYETKLGKKLGRLAEKSVTLEALTTVREERHFVRQLPESRQRLIQRIIAAEGTAEYNRRLLRVFVDGLIQGSKSPSAGLGNQGTQADHKLGLLEQNLGQVLNGTEAIALSAYAHTLRALTDDELEEFAAFCESEPARWYRDRVFAGTKRAIFEAGVALGRISAQFQSGSKGKPLAGEEKSSGHVEGSGRR